MWTLIILFLALINSFLGLNLFFKEWRLLTKIASCIPIAIILLGSFSYLIYTIYNPFLETPFFTVLLLCLLFTFLLIYHKFQSININLSIVKFVFCGALFIFSFWLMFSSFLYNQNLQTLEVGSHLWSDFGSHIPLIRSFSVGKNIPTEFPLFPNESIRYHFLFYFLGGMFEKFDGNIAFGFNLISALSFFSLGILIFELALNLFEERRSVGILAVVLTLLNSSLAFVYFFKDHSLLNLNTYTLIFQRNHPFANGPYENDVVATFWSLNIYLNQRHLALSFAIVLVIIIIFHQILVLKKDIKIKHFILAGLLTGLLPFWHAQVFIMVISIVFLMSIFFFKKTFTMPLLIFGSLTSLLALPQIKWLQGNNLNVSTISFNPGYLISPPLAIFKVLFWWFQNLGFTLLLLIESVLNQKKNLILFYICFIPIFFLGFLFKFSPDIATNHKFFNFWLIITNLYIAAFLIKMFTYNIFGKLFCIILICILTLSGILELFPIKNDAKIAIKDWQLNPISNWVGLNTKKDAIFLTSNSLYHPVSLVGRKVFLGWPYFAWSAGSDTITRGTIVEAIYLGSNKDTVCQLLNLNKIDYISIEKGLDNSLYWKNKLFFDIYFIKVFESNVENITYYIYNVAKSCKK